MKPSFHRSLSIALLVLLGAFSAPAQEKLAQGFQHPPDSARPLVFWFWINGNITREGITADLEAMKRDGIGGGLIMNVRCETPHGPVQILSPEWRHLMRHAFVEADRLGLQLGVHNAPGYTSSGGSWIKPQDGMQIVTTSETRVSGPAQVSLKLPQPEIRDNFYRDIAVLAFRSLPGDGVNVTDFKPVVSTSDPNVNALRFVYKDPETIAQMLRAASLALTPAQLADRESKKLTRLPVPEPGKPQYIQLEFPEPFEARTLTVWMDGVPQSNEGELQVSDDGKSFRRVRGLVLKSPGWEASWQSETFDLVKARFFRLLLTNATAKSSKYLGIAQISLGIGSRFDQLRTKAGFVHAPNLEPDLSYAAHPSQAVSPEQMLNLTSKLDSTGTLTWPAPAGDWTILRLGHTSKAKHTHQSPSETSGLEIDKFSRKALDAFWSGMMAPLVQDAGPLVGRSFDFAEIDSYEVGAQNWTPLMRQEFRQRRGYDLLPFLPALTGRVVGSTEQTERFLWDFRRTMADLVAENYYGYFAQLCHKHGLKFYSEVYGNGNFDDLQCASPADVPMAEFWRNGWTLDSLKLASSVAHTHGRTVVAAEAFTSSRNNFNADLPALKPVGDMAFCEGINRYVFHVHPLQPWLDRFPGMTATGYGTHLERNQTWRGEPGAAWFRYIARCQFLLQSGQFVADLCFYEGENAPAELPPAHKLSPPAPAGYDYDGCDLAVLRQMSVKEGRLVLPGGMSYQVLVLPPSRFMTPAALRKVRELVKTGATVIATAKPEKSPSLVDFPRCDREVASMAEEVWGNCDGQSVQEHKFGKGRVIVGRPLKEVLASMGASADFEPRDGMRFIHRRNGEADIYFVSNQKPAAREVECVFRVSGKQPELWHPDTGVMELAPVWSERDGLTGVPLRFDPAGSVFVVFRKAAGPADHVIAMSGTASKKGATPEFSNALFVTPEGKTALQAFSPGACQLTTASGRTLKAEVGAVPAPLSINGPWTVHFPPNWGAPESIQLEKLISWTEHADSGVRYFSGTADYTKEFEVSPALLEGSRQFWLDMGAVKDFASVTLNGQAFDPLWKPPFRLEVTHALKPGRNVLLIKITNGWDNRLIGDEQLPDDCEWNGSQLKRWPDWLLKGQKPPHGRLTFTTSRHYAKDSPLLPSGLLGPVVIRAAEIQPVSTQ